MRYLDRDAAIQDTIVRALTVYTLGADPRTVFDIDAIAAETIFVCDDLYEYAEPEAGLWATAEAHRRGRVCLPPDSC